MIILGLQCQKINMQSCCIWSTDVVKHTIPHGKQRWNEETKQIYYKK